jgi:hypothetical protein
MKDFGKSRTGHANLPTDVKIKDYPKQSGMGGDLDDTITGIDECVRHGKGQANKHRSKQH